MKFYYYFLFRLYWTFRDFSKEGHKMSLISTSLASTFFLYFTLYTIIGLIYFFEVSSSLNLGVNYKIWILSIMFILWILNYFLFIKPREFLRQDFKKDKKGGSVIISLIALLIFLFVLGANINREKIVEEQEKGIIQNKR
jgi:hypothetical protein